MSAIKRSWNNFWKIVTRRKWNDDEISKIESKEENSIMSRTTDGGPKEIEIQYSVHSVSNIDAKSNTYEIDAEVFFFWNEPKAVGRPLGEILHLKKEDMFDPQIYVTNQHELHHHHYETRVLDSFNGDVVCSVHYRGTLYITGMDLRYFPFDCQNLQIGLRTTRLEAEKVLLKPRFPNSLHHHGVHEWIILDHLLRDFLTDPNLSSAHKEYSIMFITILVKRQSIWFVNNIFIISGLLVMFSWASYIYPPVSIISVWHGLSSVIFIYSLYYCCSWSIGTRCSLCSARFCRCLKTNLRSVRPYRKCRSELWWIFT
jgi:hypothetical protein